MAIVACLCLFSCITCSALSVTQKLFYFLVTNFGRLIVQGKGSMQSKKMIVRILCRGRKGSNVKGDSSMREYTTSFNIITPLRYILYCFAHHFKDVSFHNHSLDKFILDKWISF